MRLSRVLLAGVAVAGAVATTSAFTTSNTFTPGGGADTEVGYGQLTASGVTISNVAYAPEAADATMLDKVTFTVAEDVVDTSAFLTLTGATDTTLLGGSPITCDATTSGAPNTIVCNVPDANDVLITDVTKVALTVTAK